ncbi:Rgg/GadR/MutR family transcriptional regulator [Leuconostoc miyukkimchii]|uniref:Rgg/GadR/MutR family transcriptional regulator n=1 Tax=Leuconostoc miyukkimchii TaxID=910540 RepID=UPI001C7DF114|nr:Rgg/GadR/MutR family transcriptional regulator [Leuconostoc miyukkimchii]
MIDYGATFKRLREDKGLKIVDLEQVNISRSLIGKFEKGQTRMSADRLDKLLADMGVSHDEFLFLGGETNNNYIYTTLQNIGTQTGKAKEIQHLEKVISQSTFDLRHGRGGINARFMREFGLMVKAGFDHKNDFDELYQSDQVQKHVKPAVNFLKATETWGRMELDLFMLFYIGMGPDDLLVLGRLATQKAGLYSQLRTEKKRLLDIIYTAFNGLLYIDLNGATEMLLQEEKILSSMNESLIDLTSERIRLRAGKGLLKIMSGDTSNGIKAVMSVVEIYELVGLLDNAADLKNIAERTQQAIITGKTNEIPHMYSLLI